MPGQRLTHLMSITEREVTEAIQGDVTHFSLLSAAARSALKAEEGGRERKRRTRCGLIHRVTMHPQLEEKKTKEGCVYCPQDIRCHVSTT